LSAQGKDAQGWETLPTRERERNHFEHSIEWAQQVFVRTMNALDAGVRFNAKINASNRVTGRLFVVQNLVLCSRCRKFG
jgi:hypothetical protein